ncbi:MAG: hypothetical protein AAGF28_05350 [Pseudomonadota bacterium]
MIFHRKNRIALGFLASIASGLMVGAMPASAQDAPVCEITENRLTCAENTRDGAAVLDAMANPETTAKLTGLLNDPAFNVPLNRRETYRRSLERNRRSIARHARQQLRAHLRGRVSKEDYAMVREKFEAAMMTYGVALNLYRKTIWTDPRPGGA